ncbi:hypothetical protein XENOCAPTIV_022703 [Xenoophorus captivus]|uniref:Uncharacterized protein n=1 Tax=Xenoophorus captivus TaxID=1517983 RepID=A0ABV0R1N9_9TELE
MMSYIQSKRELAKKHQAPSEETLREFKEIVIKSEEEDDVQSGLQEFTRTAQINLHRTGMKHQRYWRCSINDMFQPGITMQFPLLLYLILLRQKHQVNAPGLQK